MYCRVVHLTSVHCAFDNRIFHKECKSLATAGYDVTLVAPNPDSKTIDDAVKLVAVRPPKNRSERVARTIWDVYGAALRTKAEIYHFHDPELMPVGVLLKAQGKKVIYDVHEDYPNTISCSEWVRPVLRRPLAAGTGVIEMVCSTIFDRVIAATPIIAARFPSAKTNLVQNYPWREELCPSPASTSYRERDPIVVYVGRLSNVRGLREMVSAVLLVAPHAQVKLVTAGEAAGGGEADLELGYGTGLVEHRGLLNRTEVAELMAHSRVGIVVLNPLKAYVQAQPTKLYEYMSAGLPVVASDFPIWREIVTSAECGLLVDPLNPQAIAEALLWLLQHPEEAEKMGQRGRRAVHEIFNWERESKQLLAIYAGLRPARGRLGQEAQTKPAGAEEK
jgi:glycosyltransferase involved in cell wall biosynthesis